MGLHWSDVGTGLSQIAPLLDEGWPLGRPCQPNRRCIRQRMRLPGVGSIRGSHAQCHAIDRDHTYRGAGRGIGTGHVPERIGDLHATHAVDDGLVKRHHPEWAGWQPLKRRDKPEGGPA